MPTFLAIKEDELAKRTSYPARLGMCGIWMWMVSAAFFSVILICWMTLIPFETREVVELWIDFFFLWLHEDFHSWINRTESMERKTIEFFLFKKQQFISKQKTGGKMPDKFKQSHELFFKANLFIKMTLKYVSLCITEYVCLQVQDRCVESFSKWFEWRALLQFPARRWCWCCCIETKCLWPAVPFVSCECSMFEAK